MGKSIPENRRSNDCGPSREFTGKGLRPFAESSAKRAPRDASASRDLQFAPGCKTILEHSLEVVEMARPLIEAVYRRDRDLASWFFNHSSASQLRRAISSVALNLAEGFGCTGGSARARFETARGSLNEAQAGVRVAVSWRYVTQAAANELLESMHSIGGRVFGLCRR